MTRRPRSQNVHMNDCSHDEPGVTLCLCFPEEPRVTSSTIRSDAGGGWAWERWRRILGRGDPDDCAYCGKALTDDTRTVDHVVPRHLGGRDHLTNLVLACVVCNLAKGHQDPVTFIRSMRKLGTYRGDRNEVLRHVGAQPPRTTRPRTTEPDVANLDGWVARRSGMSAFREAELRRRQ